MFQQAHAVKTVTSTDSMRQDQACSMCAHTEYNSTTLNAYILQFEQICLALTCGVLAETIMAAILISQIHGHHAGTGIPHYLSVVLGTKHSTWKWVSKWSEGNSSRAQALMSYAANPLSPSNEDRMMNGHSALNPKLRGHSHQGGGQLHKLPNCSITPGRRQQP